MSVPEPIVQEALAAARAAMRTGTDVKHSVPGITLDGAVRAALDAVWDKRQPGGPANGGCCRGYVGRWSVDHGVTVYEPCERCGQPLEAHPGGHDSGRADA